MLSVSASVGFCLRVCWACLKKHCAVLPRSDDDDDEQPDVTFTFSGACQVSSRSLNCSHVVATAEHVESVRPSAHVFVGSVRRPPVYCPTFMVLTFS